MSNFSKCKAPVKYIRSLFFLMAVVSSLLFMFPLICHAENDATVSEPNENIASEETPEDNLKEVPEDTLEVMSEESSEDTSEKPSENILEEASDDTAENTPESQEADKETAAGENTEGISEETTEKSTATFTKNIYHKHTGSSKGGGCYSIKKTGTKTETKKCNGSMVYWPDLGTSQCSNCGASYSGDQSHRKCWHEESTTVKYTYYELGCKKSTSTLLGTLTVEQSTTEWTKALTLTGSYEVIGDMTVSSQPYIWNGEAATECNTYEVTASGDYTLRLNADSNANTEAGTVKVKVRNVDVTAPVIRAHILEPESEWTKEGVLVTITDIVDLQPDGSEGCGLHEQPYSFDGGESWTVENSHLYMDNGTHSILVRDALENTSSYDVTFYNVDCTGPTIQAADYDHTKNIRSTTLTITAADLQPDGSEGCGLHETPYSFDGGVTWTADNTLSIDRNGTITVAVRDKLENIRHMEIVITNIDCMGPEISYKMKPHSWTNKDVTLYLEAKDINEDGSNGIGLEDSWYSLDGGKTWSDKKERVYKKNQEITVIARDKHNNQSKQHIVIKQIDRELPWVTLSMEVTGAGNDMQVKLIAAAGDNYSGLHEEAYSWDKGCSYGTENTKIVTENGTYQVTVRDKAGNWRYALLEVNVFSMTEPLIITEETKETEKAAEEPEKQTVETQETETEEAETKTYTIRQEERVQMPVKDVVQELREDKWSLQDTLLLLCLLLLGLGLLSFLLFLWLHTIAIYAEDTEGKMQHKGRQWIHYRDEHYEVTITTQLLEHCETTHFNLRPSQLFAKLHKENDICCIFPEDICITKKIEHNIDVSLL